MKTCRHFRNRVPRELADELRDSDPFPCEVCDSLPHRQAMFHDTDSESGATVWSEIEEASTLIPCSVN